MHSELGVGACALLFVIIVAWGLWSPIRMARQESRERRNE